MKSDVHMLLAADGKTVQSLHEESIGLETGDVKAVNPRTSTLTVIHEEGERTRTVARDARIIIDGKVSKLADLKEGMEVDLWTRELSS